MNYKSLTQVQTTLAFLVIGYIYNSLQDMETLKYHNKAHFYRNSSLARACSSR